MCDCVREKEREGKMYGWMNGNGMDGWTDGWREIVGMGGEDLYSGMGWGRKRFFLKKKKNLLERED